MRTKKVVYTGRRGKIARLGHSFERGVPKDVPWDIAMRLIVHYPREHEVVWEGRLEDSLVETVPPEVADTPVAVAPDVVDEPAPAIEAAPDAAPRRGRPKKPAPSR